MRSTQVTFRMPREHEREFLESYMTDAWWRFEAHDDVEAAWFWRFGATSDHGPIELEGGETIDGEGGVILVVNGAPDPAPAIEAEREHWEREAETPRLRDWTTKTYRPEYENAEAKMVENYGSAGADRAFRFRTIAGATTVRLLEAFDDELPAVGEETPDDPVPMGQWAMIHYLFKGSGHDWYGEIDACRKAIENRLHSIATHLDAETAKAELDRVIAEFEAMRGELGDPAN